ncbi:hypothetical protein MPH_03124 [Macrophomina phaseolina MS6]|uniref:Uncharacterized protein n=1 Tax=Macrophomina phaseolina (strain MS6) TaxID=1126212 RepID=K2R9S9_MACPH|nr:hypothetical protein MPH_03124 [Macrophomina phaseolina MS6]
MEAALHADDFDRVKSLLDRVDRTRKVYRPTQTDDHEIPISNKEIQLCNPRNLINAAARNGSWHIVDGLLEGYYTEPANECPSSRRPVLRSRPLPTHATICAALEADEEQSLPILATLHAYEPSLFHTAFLAPKKRGSPAFRPQTSVLNLAIRAARLHTIRWLLSADVDVAPTPAALAHALDAGDAALPVGYVWLCGWKITGRRE